MKRVILIIAVMTASFECIGQRYELWLQTTDIQFLKVKTLELSNDSVLSLFSNHTWYTPSKIENFRWDNIYEIKIRNKTNHNFGMVTGFAVGFLATYLILSNDNFNKTYDWGAPLMKLMCATAVGGAGTFIGHFMTPKIIIPLNGKSSKEKNQALQNFIHKKPVPKKSISEREDQ
jgi:hypothetical protein